ncbi:protein of unknown function [Streptomyces sp. KY75]|nr:protein of unknown function [Streptomyces sp. KY70]CAD5986882.1 protein of unknown function [Streptomyces sp. KY75]
MNEAADNSMPGPDGTTAAAPTPSVADAVPVAAVSADPASTPVISTAVSLRPLLPDVLLNSDPTPMSERHRGSAALVWIQKRHRAAGTSSLLHGGHGVSARAVTDGTGSLRVSSG